MHRVRRQRPEGRRYPGLPLAAILALLLAASSPADAGQGDVSRLRHSVRALWQVRQHVGRTLADRQKATGLLPGEKREIEVFLAFLLGRIREDCRQLVQVGGGRAVAGLNCPAGGAALPGQQGTAARTSGEEVELLEQQLARAMGEFDDMLLREEERLAARVPRRRESGDGAVAGGREGVGREGRGRSAAGETDGSADRRTGTEDGSGDRDRIAGQGRSGTAATGRDQTPAGRNGKATAGGVAATAPSGGRPPDVDAMAADDDIVARQLREAAERETDPALKEKLWQEYRRYRARQ